MSDTVAGLALDDVKTHTALDRYRERSVLWLAAGLVAIVAFGLLAVQLLGVDRELSPVPWLVATAGLAAGCVAVCVGASGAVRAARMRRVLRRHPWRRWTSRCTQPHFGSYERNSLWLSPDGDCAGLDHPAITAWMPSMLRTTLARSGLPRTRVVEVAGDPTAGHAVVRAEGHELLIPVRGRAVLPEAELVGAAR
jgi:hypothetical protein